MLLTACVLQTKAITLGLQLERLALRPGDLLGYVSTSNPSAEDEKVQHVAERRDRFAFCAKGRNHLGIHKEIDSSRALACVWLSRFNQRRIRSRRRL